MWLSPIRIGGPNFSPTVLPFRNLCSNSSINRMVHSKFRYQNLETFLEWSAATSRCAAELRCGCHCLAHLHPRGVWLVQHSTPTMNPEMVSLTNALSHSDRATILLPLLPYWFSCVWALVITTYDRNEGKFSGARQSEVLQKLVT